MEAKSTVVTAQLLGPARRSDGAHLPLPLMRQRLLRPGQDHCVLFPSSSLKACIYACMRGLDGQELGRSGGGGGAVRVYVYVWLIELARA